jgi:hypothetical protein
MPTPRVNMTKAILPLFALWAASIFAGEPGPEYELVSQDKPDSEWEFFGGPHIDIVTEVYHRKDGESPAFKIVLSSLADPSQKELLFEYDRAAQAELSPDGKWFIVNDRPVRGECNPRLFKQKKGLKFGEVEDAGIRKKAINFFIGENKYPASMRGHLMPEGDCYVESVLWSDDSKSLLLRLSKGQTGEPLWVYNWRCVYDLKTGRVSTDLKVLNRGAVLPGKYLTTHQH